MALDERKRKILQAVVDDYIETAEPVASKALVRRHDFHVQSATVRNEMANLEEMGYLDIQDNKYCIARDKLDYANHVFCEFV